MRTFHAGSGGDRNPVSGHQLQEGKRLMEKRAKKKEQEEQKKKDARDGVVDALSQSLTSQRPLDPHSWDGKRWGELDGAVVNEDMAPWYYDGKDWAQGLDDDRGTTEPDEWEKAPLDRHAVSKGHGKWEIGKHAEATPPRQEAAEMSHEEKLGLLFDHSNEQQLAMLRDWRGDGKDKHDKRDEQLRLDFLARQRAEKAKKEAEKAKQEAEAKEVKKQEDLRRRRWWR
jgi:hypothetical protein